MMKQWSTAEHDGCYHDQAAAAAAAAATVPAVSLRRIPPRYVAASKSNGNCGGGTDSLGDPAPAADIPLTTQQSRTPAIPAHHHLYWQAASVRCHSNAASPTAID